MHHAGNWVWAKPMAAKRKRPLFSCQTGSWGRPCVAGEALHPTRSADGREAPGVLVATTRGRFVFLPVTGLSSDRQLNQMGVLQNLA